MNVNCWSKNNGILREKLVKTGNPDIICVVETHLRDEDESIEGFNFIGLNRKLTNNKALRSSGGIGIFFKQSLNDIFNIDICHQFRDNVLGIKLTSKFENESLLVYCVYLPPDGSRYAGQNEEILNRLVIEIYQQYETDNIIICGDFNARIGCKPDITAWDNVKPRKSLDNIWNAQGEKLLTFINDARCCVLNGRICENLDDYTSVASHKGNCGGGLFHHQTVRHECNNPFQGEKHNRLDGLKWT